MKNILLIAVTLFTLASCVVEKDDQALNDDSSNTTPEGSGGSDTDACVYSGDDVIIRPIAILSGERRPGNPIRFSVANAGWVSYECRGGYSWNFGDGSVGSGFEIYHAFNSAGDYVVTLIATSKDGTTSTATREVNIIQQANH